MTINDKWIVNDGTFYPIPGDSVIHTTPGDGVWELVQDPDPRSNRLGLKKISDKFTFDFKIYETGGSEAIKRVCDLWNNEDYVNSNKNLGIVFNGIKGSGKTISAKILCNQIDLPVIIVNQSFEGAILDFIPRLSFEAVILIDEAEKTFAEKEDDHDHILLKLIDGVYNKTRKLYILTTNKLSINDNLLGRPGRIRYIQEFSNLPKQAVEEYIDDNLKDKTKKSEILDIVDTLEISTIDILKSIIEEFNIFGEIGGDHSMLNIPKCQYTFDAVFFRGYGESDVEWIRETIKTYKPKDVDLYKWFTENRIEGEPDELPNDKKVSSNDDEESGTVMSLFEKPSKYCFVSKISSKYSLLCKGLNCNQGTLVSDVSDDGFLLIKTNYGDVELYLLLKQQAINSIYKSYIL